MMAVDDHRASRLAEASVSGDLLSVASVGRVDYGHPVMMFVLGKNFCVKVEDTYFIYAISISQM